MKWEADRLFLDISRKENNFKNWLDLSLDSLPVLSLPKEQVLRMHTTLQIMLTNKIGKYTACIGSRSIRQSLCVTVSQSFVNACGLPKHSARLAQTHPPTSNAIATPMHFLCGHCGVGQLVAMAARGWAWLITLILLGTSGLTENNFH